MMWSPWYRDLTGDLVERANEITLRQLIQHTSGIPNWFVPELVSTFDFTTRY
ncbi:hypothetical protein ACFOY2_53115 [Nonomuraea purpurea]|uniref:Beta-lactamase-related domain-containing protein n=1 Tax=Nonomuraea purpurea TaxID=1849276 RepID=A0ABV8GPX0_9ACTN